MTYQLTKLMTAARSAQTIFEEFSQTQVDACVRAVGKVIFDNAETLAIDAVAETGMGNVQDKTLKNKGKPRNVWNYLKNKKSIGVIKDKNAEGIITVAKPVGVVGAVTPTTSPTMTIMCNVMFALKGGNSIIIAPHPRAKDISARTVELINDELNKLGAPDNLLQIIREPSMELTNELMSAVDVLVATGGPAMVKAAYSSGKPSFGVGAGNVQTIIDQGVDYITAARKIITGRIFDNGIICSGDQSIIIPAHDFVQVIEAFKSEGAYYVDDLTLANRFREALFDNGYMRPDVIGQSVKTIASLVGIELPLETKVIVIKSDGSADDILRSEKMCPVLTAFAYDTLDDAIAIASANLEIRGKGHTCVIHSDNQANIEKISLQLPVSRIAINESGSLSVGGALHNGFVPTGTLGCGSWGNNSISENLSFKHMINTQRIGFTVQGKSIPTDEEIWS
ncbi:MAG: succinate-semialdehyde dehydrogenase [Alteromonadaceae bacterium]|jgi:succinate-semialdehyde dehydrogenase